MDEDFAYAALDDLGVEYRGKLNALARDSDDVPVEKSMSVSVRVRPFTEEEATEGTPCVLTMPNAETVSLKDPNTGDEKDYLFTAGHCFWSHDKPTTTGTEAQGVAYAGQEDVMKRVGSPMLKRFFEGHQCCLLLYGQTGSGKSYTLNNPDPDNLGLMHRLCQGIFHEKQTKTSDSVFSWVTISSMELYNDEIHDLLNPHMSKNTPLEKSGLSSSTIVNNMVILTANTYEEAEKLLSEAHENRKVRNLKDKLYMKCTFTFTYIMLVQHNIEQKTTTNSTFTLVEMAGSENFGSTKGDATTATHKSVSDVAGYFHNLSTNDIFAALIQSTESTTAKHLLNYALEGNTITHIIATISPAAKDFTETKATLRTACKAQQIKLSPKVELMFTSNFLKTFYNIQQGTHAAIISKLQTTTPDDSETISHLTSMKKIYAQEIKNVLQRKKRTLIPLLTPKVNFYSRIVDATALNLKENKLLEAKDNLSSFMLRLVDDLSVLLGAGIQDDAQLELMKALQLLEKLPENQLTSKVISDIESLVKASMMKASTSTAVEKRQPVRLEPEINEKDDLMQCANQ